MRLSLYCYCCCFAALHVNNLVLTNFLCFTCLIVLLFGFNELQLQFSINLLTYLLPSSNNRLPVDHTSNKGNRKWKTQVGQQQRPFNGLCSGTTRVGRYQKEHSPTHTHPDHRASFIIFLHLQRSMASSLFNLRA